MKHVLILEDILEVVASLVWGLARLEKELGISIKLTVYSTSNDVAQYVNDREAGEYDLIILDRNCKIGGSFHVLDIEKFGGDKVISISSLPHLNQKARQRGVKQTVEKNHHDLEGFSEEVINQARSILKTSR